MKRKKNRGKPTITVNCTPEFKRKFQAYADRNRRSANAQAILVMEAAMEAEGAGTAGTGQG